MKRTTLSSCILLLFIAFPLFSQIQDTLRPNYSPYTAVYNHLFYLQNDSYDPLRAAESFSSTEPERFIEEAKKLKQILDGKGYFINLSKIPTDPSYMDSIGLSYSYTILPSKLPQVYLTKIDSSWFYSEETVNQLDRLHKNTYPLGAGWLMNLFPDNSGHETFFGIKIWQWVGFGLILIFLLSLYFILRTILNFFLKKIDKTKSEKIVEARAVIKNTSKIVSVLFLISVARILIRSLMLPIKVSESANITLNIFSKVFFGLLAIQVLIWILLQAKQFFEETENRMDNQLLPILDRSGRILIIFLTTLSVLSEVGVNITALLAGISIGGLALALAAQDTVRNLIGSFMIFIDRPFEIGDNIEANGVEGEVEEVGFRSTKIRKIDSSLAIIPNGKISDQMVNNYGPRFHRIFHMDLTLEYNTSTDKIRSFIDALKQVILDQEETNKESYYVVLRRLSESSIDIYFRSYLNVDSFKEELRVKEEMLYKILDLAESLGISFAFPSMSIYQSKD